MINVFGEEKFKPLVRYNKIISFIQIGKDGRVYSERSRKFLKLSADYSKRSGRLEALRFSTVVDASIFDDYEYAKIDENTQFSRLTFRVHKAVMDTWRPIDEYPPDQLKDTWNQVPEEWRQWVRDTAYIDHIDDDPTNNHVDNLRWVTPKENCIYRKKQKKLQ